MAQNIKFPKTNVPILSASLPIENSDQKVLFVGQASTFPASDTLYENIPNSASEINALFGEGSILAQMLIAARKINKVVQFDAISPVTSAGAFAASTATITITGTDADAAGNVDVVLGSSVDGSFSVAYAIGDTPTDVAAAIAAYINLAANKIAVPLGFTASSALGVVTITATNTGVICDEVSLSASLSDADLGVTVAGFFTTSTGVENPDTSSSLDVIGEERYQTIVWPYLATASADLIPTLDSRFNATNDVQDGVAIVSKAGLFATVLADVGTYNSQSLVYIAQLMETDSANESTGIVELPWIIAAQFAAIRSLRRQPDANISDLVISRNGALDSIGGPALSSKPYANTPMALLPNIPVGKGFISTEITQLNDAGATVLGNNKAKTSVIMGQVLTTYKTDSAGDDDDSFKFLNYVDTASTAREYFFNNLASRYAQSRLTDGNLIKGRDMTNAENIRAEMTGFYQTLADVDYVVARKGEDVLQFFKENMSVTIDLLTGTANIVFSLPIVTQLREINAPMQLTFNIE